LQEERFIGIAPWGAPVSPVHRSALLGQSLTWRSLGRSLRGNARWVRRGLASGKAKLKNSVPAASVLATTAKI